MKVTLRNATLADLPLLLHWDKQQHVIDCDPDDDWNWKTELARTPKWRAQLIAMLNDRPLGFLQIIDPQLEESHYWGEIGEGFRAIDIWIGEAGDLRKGYGTQMMKLALDRCFQDPSVHTVLIDPLASNLDALRFYEHLGFEFLERRRFGASNCLVYQYQRPDK